MKRYIVLFMAVLVFAAMGCESLRSTFRRDEPAPVVDMDNGGVSSSVPAAPVEDVGIQPGPGRFEGVPVPMGAKEDVERTFVYESPQIKVGRLVYSSRASLGDLTEFYLRECKAAGWRLDDITQAAGAHMKFHRTGQRLTVSIRNSGPVRGRELSILLTPDAS